jgi:hypothetical protein
MQAVETTLIDPSDTYAVRKRVFPHLTPEMVERSRHYGIIERFAEGTRYFRCGQCTFRLGQARCVMRGGKDRLWSQLSMVT